MPKNFSSRPALTWAIPGLLFFAPCAVQAQNGDASATLRAFVGLVTAIDGANISLGVGTVQGLTSGQIVPLTRAGAIVALVKISVASAQSSTATLVWSDETKGGVTVGDSVNLLGTIAPVAPPATSETPVAPSSNAPGVIVPFETGASNASVPKASRTYELLATLAAQGLITSQPARVFQDDGARRHRYEEDFVFTRAQVAAFIREALQSEKNRSGTANAALNLLIGDFGRELRILGVENSVLAAFETQKGFKIGFSGFTRARVTGGDDDDSARLALGERFGAGRAKSGVDARLNLFGSLSDRLTFYGSLDTGTKLISGNSDRRTEFRKAYVSYDASNLLRGLSFDLGRKEYYWGVGNYGTGVLGDAAGGLNSFSTKYNKGIFHFESVAALLGTGPAGGKRSLYGNKISADLGPQTRIGLTSTLLKPKDKFDPLAFALAQLPISLYAVKQLLDDDEQNNTVVGAFAETSLARGTRLYGELTLDDLSFNGNNRIENRNGGLVGIQLYTPRNPAKGGLKAEYARLNSTSYIGTRRGRDEDYDYYYRDAPLGYPIAPLFPTNFGGADSLRFEGYYMPAKKLTLHLGAEFSDINSQDQNPAANGERGFSRQQIYRVALAYDLARNLALTARVQRINSDQPDFIKRNNSEKQNLFSLEIGQSF